MSSTDRFVPSSEVARRLGIKTQTLAVWRCKGKGPTGWVHLSATRVVYPEQEVEAFIRTLVGQRPEFNFQKPTATKMIAATVGGVTK